MQVCHGKLAPIRRVQPGDRVAYYAPTVTMGGKDTCQSLCPSGSCFPVNPIRFATPGRPKARRPPRGKRSTRSGKRGGHVEYGWGLCAQPPKY